MVNRKICAILSATLLIAILSGCGGATSVTETTGAGNAMQAQLVAISVMPTNPRIAKDTTQQFTATGIYSDNTTTDLTASVTWSSSDTGIAAMGDPAPSAADTSTQTAPKNTGNNGHAYGKNAGSTTVTATSGSVSGSTTLTVTAATLMSIGITPASQIIAVGTSQQFVATGAFSDSSTQDLTASVTWNSSNTVAATISGSGLASSVAAGSTTVTAGSGGISGSATLAVTSSTLVSIAVTPSNPSIAKGTTQQFSAIGTFSDNTTQDLTRSVSWNSSNTGVATANGSGLASSVAAGSTTITAASGSVLGSTSLTVTPATLASLAVTPTNPNITVGNTQQFVALGTFSDSSTQDLTTTATWSSSNTAVAPISNAAGSKGLATGIATGTTTITSISGTVSKTVTLIVAAPGLTILSWDATTTNTDGSAAAITGYKLYYGRSSGFYTSVIDAGAATSYTFTNLPSGVYYFAVTAYDASGNESDFSNEVSRTAP